MGLFDKKELDKKEEKKPIVKSSAVVEADKKSSSPAVVTQEGAGLAYKFIVKPWITEKTQELMTTDKYVFRLRAKTTKREAKVAIEKLYNVKVIGVNIVNIPSKKRRFGRYTGMKSAVRKAIVTLKKGDKIEIFE
ncbi:MAG: 50S ribosomal protein L23 [Candidatus Moranbacteria bacterium]|nr:50S ribosomal protein L23 [Candidatus Moranbacteria bacterium]